MTRKPLSGDLVNRIVALRQQGLSYRAIGAELCINASTAMNYCKKFMKQGGALDANTDKGAPSDPVDVPIDDQGPTERETRIVTPDRPKTLKEMTELFGVNEHLWVPQTVRANEWQGFYKIKDGTGHRKVALWQTRITWKRVVPEEVEEAIVQFVREHVKPLPKPNLGAPRVKGRPEAQLVAWGLWDSHLGMHAWHSEVGEDYDLKIASRRVMHSIDDMVEELNPYPIAKILMPIGNDFMHFDSVRHKTSHGEHYLDTDNRYGKVFLEALRCLSYQVERAMELCDDVEILYVPGNHDMATAFCLTVALDQRYQNDPRFSSDLSFNPRKWRQHGETLLGFEHGQKCKPQKLVLSMAEECRHIWHEVRYREIQIGHTHQRNEAMHHSLTPNQGVLIRTNPSLCNVDSWHHAQGMLGEPTKSVEAWRYDRMGYRGSHVAWARD